MDGDIAGGENLYIAILLESLKCSTQIFKKEEDIYNVLMGSSPDPF